MQPLRLGVETQSEAAMIEHRERPRRHFVGEGMAVGAAIGLLFGLLLAGDLAMMLIVGVAAGLVAGAGAELLRSR